MDTFETFCSIFPFDKTTKEDHAIAFGWFFCKSTGNEEFDLRSISQFFYLASLPAPNTTRLKNALTKNRNVHRGKNHNSFKLSRKIIDEMNEKYGEVFDGKPVRIVDQAGVDKTPLLSESEINDAYKMAELYIILHCYENSVRKLIENVLYKEIGADWWESASNAQLRGKVKNRKEVENKNKWLSPRGNGSPLYYVDWGDLVSIIRKFESFFLPIIKELKFVELRLEELEKLRNIVAHNGYLPSDEDFQRIVLSFRDWCRQIR
ncbi:Swt1 family HEPN domain-containing protein [Paenibacillus sp. p3-SID1389]|uniref:Swt1 family HEPN domain-containing protein n=1 Tax=Paenibacillus sp. p3-SID1389 TaxID=2916364 RepID=UPI0021A65A6A|nr:Swt1 family HEPN domain-containing protein [Paenibacillus sp. p3-SID1389]MCT2197593.1 Swt1 family HEPN domain-containing protein [Paenibacillus sp. p3-SID1389]